MARANRVPQQQRAVETRKRILHVADQRIIDLVFNGRGLLNLNIGDIIREAEVSPGTFYDYFADQDALLDALFSHHVGMMEAHFASAFETGPGFETAADLIDQLFLSVSEFAENEPGYRALWSSGALQGHRREADRTSDKMLVEAIVAILAEAGFVGATSQVARDHLNLTWHMAEALMWEAFDLAIDAGPVLGPPDAEAIAAGREILHDRMSDPEIWNVSETS